MECGCKFVKVLVEQNFEVYVHKDLGVRIFEVPIYNTVVLR